MAKKKPGKGAAEAAPKKRGRPKKPEGPKPILSKGELTGAGAWILPAAAVKEIDRWFEYDADTADELIAAWASYQADLEAWGKRPSRAQELSDLTAIAQEAKALAARPDLAADPRELLQGETRELALRLSDRLLNFPPVSRGLASDVPSELLAFESLLGWLKDYLPRPVHWQSFDLAGSLKSLAATCERIDPPGFTKRPFVARRRLIDALGKFHDERSTGSEDERLFEPGQDRRETFIRAILEALGVKLPPTFEFPKR